MRIGSIRPREGANRRSKRRGLGTASGLGGTSGRGHKGQKARTGGKVPRWFEGGQMPYQRRIPKQGFTNIRRVPYQVVNVASLARFAGGEAVTPEALRAKRLIGRPDLPVKILGNGEIQIPLSVSVDAVSASARQKIEAAGGTITLSGTSRGKARRSERPAGPGGGS
ncbi:MAG TPA: 50S ribosomal protein L15 [Candidatus Eisenbacteria bacterium]